MTRTFAPQCRVVAFDDGAARLSALLAELGAGADVSESRVDLDTSAQTCAKTAHVSAQFPARQQPGLQKSCDPKPPPLTPAAALHNPVEVRTEAVQGASYGQGDGGLETISFAPLCEVGGSIYLRHELGIAGRCDLCGWTYPALTFNGRRG